MVDQEMDGADELFGQMQKICIGLPAADVIYAIGMMIAHGIDTNAAVKDIDHNLALIRQVVELEIEGDRP